MEIFIESLNIVDMADRFSAIHPLVPLLCESQTETNIIQLDKEDTQNFYDLVCAYPEEQSLKDIQKCLHLDCQKLKWNNAFTLEESLGLIKYAHSINLSQSNIVDVSMLGMVYKLDLSGCENLVDVSALGNVHILDLSFCPNLEDVSALGHVHILILLCCPKIVDVSALGTVHTLELSYCENLVDVSALGNVHTLALSHCSKITDVSMLGNVRTLTLMYSRVLDVSALGNVDILNLRNCKNITDVSALKNVKQLLVDDRLLNKNE